MQDQDTPCKGCEGDCRDCNGVVEWRGTGRRPIYCCTKCKNRDKAAERTARLKSNPVRCSEPSCDKNVDPYRGGTLCGMHYRRWRHGEDMDAPPRKVPLAEHRPCSVEGCDRRYSAKGLCALHYHRLRVAGAVGPAGLTQAAPGTRTEYLDPRSGYVYVYVVGNTQRKPVLKQRIVMEDLIGRPLTKIETVHHINGQRDDNRTNGPLDENFRSGNLELWSKSHPAGQRVADKVAWARELLALYAPHLLAEEASNAAR